MNYSILSQLIDQYTGNVSNIQSQSASIGLGVFNALAAIAIAVLAFIHLMKKEVDMVDANLELIKLLVYMNFFYYFIVNYNTISGLFFQAVDEIGNLLGSQASGLPTVTNIKALDLFHIGFLVAKNIWTVNLTFDLFKDFQMVLIAVLAGGVVLYCFAVIGLELILMQIGSKIILAGGIFLLAFSGLPWTRDYAERYVHSFFHIGIKMIFIYILIGFGLGLAKTWPQNVPSTSSGLGSIIDYDIAVALSAFVYYKLCLKLPDQAVSWLTGRLPTTFDTTSSVNTAVKAMAKMPSAVVDTWAGAQGMGNAVGLANQAAKINLGNEGKQTSAMNMGKEMVKTLGAASKAEWDKKVAETKGGKLAKNISGNMPVPNPAPIPSNDPNADSNNSNLGGA